MSRATRLLCVVGLLGCSTSVTAVSTPEVGADAGVDTQDDRREVFDGTDDLSDARVDATDLGRLEDRRDVTANDAMDASDDQPTPFDGAVEGGLDVPRDVWPDRWSTCPGVPRVAVPGVGTVVCPRETGTPDAGAVVCAPGEICATAGIAVTLNRCSDSGNLFGIYLRCDGAEDCDLGQLCCQGRISAAYGCASREDCGNSFLCHQDADCPCDFPRCCGIDSRFVGHLRFCSASCDGG